MILSLEMAPAIEYRLDIGQVHIGTVQVQYRTEGPVSHEVGKAVSLPYQGGERLRLPESEGQPDVENDC